ncbi:MFSD4 [Bugula neritina]|uniref:MFSD4 n=1 Tax=Bugula neritina TaxID=10212 RepID=A0A7J7J433_BUGNE|nr:MFSD4 [Bugula neritina]
MWAFSIAIVALSYVTLPLWPLLAANTPVSGVVVNLPYNIIKHKKVNMVDPSTKSSYSSSKSKKEELNKYLSGALLIWEETKKKWRKLNIKKLYSNNSSIYFLVELFCQNAGVTIGYYLLYLAFGMCVGFLGPTMEDLACYTRQTVQEISWAFFTQTACMVIGIFIAGWVSKKTANSNNNLCSSRLSGDLILLVAVIFLPVTLVAVIFCTDVFPLCIDMGIMGIAMGAIDCLANLQLVQIYGKAVAPFLQALHFFYGIGALISPLIAEPFLINKDCSMWVSRLRHYLLEMEENSEISFNDTRIAQTKLAMLHNIDADLKVTNAFWILAAVQIPIVIYWLVIVIKTGCRVKTVDPSFKKLVNSESRPILEQVEDKERKAAEKKNLKEQWKQYLNDFQGSYSIQFSKAALLTLAACATVFLYDGLQGLVNEFVQTYTIKVLKNQNEKNIGIMNVLFWFGCQIAAILFVISSNGTSFISIIFATVILGLFMSSITPTTIAMTETFMDTTNVQMSLILGGAALGEVVIPVLEGQFIDQQPQSFVMMLLTCIILSWVVYAAFWVIGRATEKFKAMGSSSFIWFNPNKADDVSSTDENGIILDTHEIGSKSFHIRSYNSTDHSGSETSSESGDSIDSRRSIDSRKSAHEPS